MSLVLSALSVCKHTSEHLHWSYQSFQLSFVLNSFPSAVNNYLRSLLFSFNLFVTDNFFWPGLKCKIRCKNFQDVDTHDNIKLFKFMCLSGFRVTFFSPKCKEHILLKLKLFWKQFNQQCDITPGSFSKHFSKVFCLIFFFLLEVF